MAARTVKTATVKAPRLQVAPEALGYFRYTQIGDKVLLTNDAGEFHFLSAPDFAAFLKGDLADDHPDIQPLRDKAFLRRDLDVEALAERVRRKKRFLANGPHLHAVITTLRCTQSCKYCHASSVDMTRTDTDMPLDVAKKVVDFAMQTTSPYVNFEYQGGEPTLNFEAVKFIVEYSREKNRHEKKELVHSIVSNFTNMDETKANWLMDNDVLVCTSLDGPEELHDYNRVRIGRDSANTFKSVMKWMRYFNERYIEMGRDPELWHVDALLTATSKTLGMWKEVVDLYVSLGIRSLHMRPLNPIGFAQRAWGEIGYTPQEFVAVYEQVLDYIIELNLKGEQIIEGTAANFLKKMLTPDDPNFVDIRSPIGSGTGQLAYFYDGTIFPSDEARMVATMGDPMFRIGHVDNSAYRDVVRHPTVRVLAVASLLDSLPACSNCFAAPYCGVRPLHNYMRTGDLFGQRPNTPKCVEHMGIMKLLFDRLANDPDGRIEAIFRRWVIDRPRTDDKPASGGATMP